MMEAFNFIIVKIAFPHFETTKMTKTDSESLIKEKHNTNSQNDLNSL